MTTAASNSTALVSACDLQALNVLQALRRTVPANTGEKAKKALTATLKNLTVKGAIGLLQSLGYGRDGFYYRREYWIISDLLNPRYFPGSVENFARETEVFTFWGGPPTKLGYYYGTLETFLRDRVLGEITHRGIETVAREIGLDLESEIQCTK